MRALQMQALRKRSRRRAATGLAAALFAAALAPLTPTRAETIDCAAPNCEAAVSSTCLRRVGAGALATDDACAAEQTAYLACLRSVAETCSAQAAPQHDAACAPEDARQMFDAVRHSDDPADLDAFIAACPDAPQARLAAVLLKRQRAEAAAPLNTLPGDWTRLAGPEDRCPVLIRVKLKPGATPQTLVWYASRDGFDLFEQFAARRLDADHAVFPYLDAAERWREQSFRRDGANLVIARDGAEICRYRPR